METERWKALELKSSGFEIEAEITTKSLLARWRISEIAIAYAPRTFQAGKKIRGKDAFIGILTSFKIWFSKDIPDIKNL